MRVCLTGWYAASSGDLQGPHKMPSHTVKQIEGLRQFSELRTCLKARGESERAFALRNKIDKSTFNRLLNGRVTQFDLDLVDKVYQGTDEKIGHDEFAVFGKRLAANPLVARCRRRKVA